MCVHNTRIVPGGYLGPMNHNFILVIAHLQVSKTNKLYTVNNNKPLIYI